jgi:hypothetical protein
MAKNPFYDSLTPFVSLTLGQPQPTLANAALAAKAVDSIGALLAPDVGTRVVVERVNAPARRDAASKAEIRAFRYKRHATPGWTDDARIVDTENHLVVAVALKGRLALHFTDVRLRGPVRINLSADAHKDLPLSWLFPVPRGIMSAAFLQGGETRTLWLAGTHRRSALKADSKILSGVDLDYALDPFDDQSFFWSSARSRQAKLSAIIGVSPASSRVWTRKEARFDYFVSATVEVLARLDTVKKPVEAPFRYLASPLTAVKPDAVHAAFDLSIMPPDMATDGESDADDIAAVSTLIYETNFDVTPDRGKTPSFSVKALRNGQSLGTFRVGVTIDGAGKVAFAVDTIKPTDAGKDKLKTVAAQVSAGHHVNVRYDTGHSISGAHVFALRNRRVSFNGYNGRDFAGFDISKEKPSTLDRIGQEDSLFCWVQRNTRGWLGCDDGSMEKADFIHLDDRATPNILSLIHVKGANSTAPGRGISVAAYEVVTGQAVKNLLWLDREDLAVGLAESVRASNHFWHDGRHARRDDFISRIKALPANCDTRVVVLQPHVSLAALARVAPDGGADRLRVDQLNALLASAERTCGGLGAKFSVICSA